MAASLAYIPSKRLLPLEGCAHPFVDELRDEATKLPKNGCPFPPLFDCTQHELDSPKELLAKLVPRDLKDEILTDGDGKAKSC